LGKKNADILREIAGADGFSKVRRSFWAYCRAVNPGFFREDRPHLIQLADALQALIEGKLTSANGTIRRKMIVNLPPRMGKSYTLTLFNQWALGRNRAEKIITVSYNEKLAERFSRAVRNGIAATRAGGKAFVFSDAFPGVRLKKGDAASGIWALEGQPMSFLAAGFGGTITGVGCSIGIIDDPVKNHLEAMNEAALDAQFQWYNDTFFSRLEEGAVQIVVMTRWATGDLAGRLTAREPDAWQVLKMPACLDEEKREMLCPELLSWNRWRQILRTTSEEIALANYQQQPIDATGRLYDHFTTYPELPRRPDGALPFEKILCYADTADTGRDYLCAVVAGVFEGRLWVLDVLYSDRGMEVTEPEMADMLVRNGVHEAWIESNNGGRGFARNVEALLWSRHSWRGKRVIPSTQRANKRSRILVAAPYVMNNVLFPSDWAARWPEYHRAMTRFLRKGANLHDDAPDATTGLTELMTGGLAVRGQFVSGRGAR
jgi:predicted phage terminase large subunit-like protein